MTAAQAQKLEHLPEVLNVWEDEVRPMAIRDRACRFIELFDARQMGCARLPVSTATASSLVSSTAV